MNAHQLKKVFDEQFDIVGVIRTSRYIQAAHAMGKSVPEIKYPTMVVVGLAYPRRTIPHTKTHLVASFYTFGQDYHTVLKNRITKVMSQLPYAYEAGVDNHPHHERLAATQAGVGYFAKNQLIINETYGSYVFLGIVFIDVELNDEFILPINESCGTCTKCIDACPVGALSEQGYEMNKCISYYNQSKRILTDEEIKANYCLFGCDICQMVCPKNLGKTNPTHPEFELTGKEAVSIVDLFTLSEKQFKQKYDGMSYLWKGKTILMRNALTVMQNRNIPVSSIDAQYLQPRNIDWYDNMLRRTLLGGNNGSL